MRYWWSSLVGFIVCLGLSGYPIILLAQETTTLPPAQSVPRESTLDVSTLPPPPTGAQQPTSAREKPIHLPDPEGLRQWKDMLQQVPGALPPSPGFIEDRPRDPRGSDTR